VSGQAGSGEGATCSAWNMRRKQQCANPATYDGLYDPHPQELTASRGERRLFCGVHGNFRMADEGWRLTPIVPSGGPS